MINVNYGHNKELLEACKPLKEYACFIDRIRFHQKDLETIDEAVDKALDDMPEDSILKPFLIANKAEVKRMCITEYDEARTISEAKEDAVLALLISLVKDGLLSLAEAAKRSNMSETEFIAKSGLNV